MSYVLGHSVDPLAHVAAPRAQTSEAAAAPRIRLGELDGVRGWGAFSVLLFHSTWETFGQAQPMFRNPFAGLLYGPLDVSVFFVVSGAALSAPFFTGGGTSYVVAAALKRYLRLTIPIVGAALLWYCALRLGLVASHEAAAFAPGFLARFDIPDLSLTQTLKWACCNVYTKPTESGPILPFLWTMQWEMAGSMALFVLLACWPALKNPGRTLFATACSLTLFFPYIAAFLFGALIGRARIMGLGERMAMALAPFDKGWVKIAAGLALYAVAVASLSTGRTSHIDVALAILCVVLIASSRPARAFLSNPLSQFLAKISFSLYLVHYIVIITFTSQLILLCEGAPTVVQALAIAAATILVSVGVAMAFLPVERLAHSASRRFATFVLEGR
jgi:peptidoglycan/LPS O-acetylase OafA/YrhL